jgi:hypothetical protein
MNFDIKLFVIVSPHDKRFCVLEALQADGRLGCALLVLRTRTTQSKQSVMHTKHTFRLTGKQYK